jgi:hypothetical protein
MTQVKRPLRLATEYAQRLFRPLFVAITTLLLSVTLMAWTIRESDTAQQHLNAATNQLAQAQSRISKSNEEERELRNDLLQYQRLVNLGMVGPERRLDWIDSIAMIKSQRRLFDISYTLEAQKPADYPGLITSKAEYAILVSRLKLNMQLLHENDLVHFFDDFSAAARTMTSLQECKLMRHVNEGVATGKARLRAECVLDLLTAREARRPDDIH